MRAVSVTLPESLAQKTEALIDRGEYTSHSEVLRTALRFLFALEEEAIPLELFQFSKRPLDEVKKELRGAGHKPEFVESVIKGLKRSSVYRKN